jgi:hypothetical protein
MMPASKKTVSMRAIGVASFTGVAACAAFAAPAAMAAPRPAGHEALVRGLPRTVRPAASSIRLNKGCGPGTANWLHLAFDQLTDSCLGYKGTYTFPSSEPVTSFCGGNNSGWIKGVYAVTGKTYSTDFHHGTTYAHIPHESASNVLEVSKVHISSWSGKDACPRPGS